MELIDKQKLLVWLKQKANGTDSWVERTLLENMVSAEIEKGTFDDHSTKERLIQAEQENAKLKKMLNDTYGFGWEIEFARRG